VTRYAGFLRAVNVGGHNKVPMARLRELATGLGYADVATYLQSGNLVLTAPAGKATAIESALHDVLLDDFGVDAEVMVRDRSQLAAVIEANPFGDIADDPKKLLVSFLHKQPTAKARGACDPEEFAPERFEFGDRCIYLWHPDGVGRSKMSVAPWGKRLGVPGTARNWRTVTTMLEMLDATS
jgi:uncharacterized protein (DUF1697 family)